MPLNDSQRKTIAGNIEKLDSLKGTGVLSNSKKQMVKELFLIISSGGIGGEALKEVKRTVIQQIDERAVDSQMMFLCCDTAHNELDQMDGELTQNEILKIPYQGAQLVITPGKMSPTTEQWVHPRLYDYTNSKSGFFDGTGASALRQCGRVMFAQSATQQRLYTSLLAIQKKAAKMSESGIPNPKLKVIFLAGIAGGTGSGTIIDLGFLTRFYLKSILPGWDSRITFSAYLFMPSACGTPKAAAGTDGNVNAYAALKEIDYFMDLKSMKDSFRMDYGTPATYNLEITDNLFDFCTLVEGIGGGGTMFGDPAATARKITALSLMNIFCTNDDGKKDANGRSVFMVDSFLSNVATKSKNAVGVHPDKVWPREANYHFDVIGYAACVVPVNLLTVYAFKKVFDKIYEVFRNHTQATPQMAEVYLQRCGLDFKSVDRNYKNLTPDYVASSLEKVSAEFFKQYGPYFMINLTNQAVGLIKDPAQGYFAQINHKLGGLWPDKNKWNYIGNLYNFLINRLVEKNNTLYDVYTYVIETMKQMLEENAGILTESKEMRSRFGYSFYWTPVDTSKGDEKAKAVLKYLDKIIDTDRTNQLAYQFVEQMYQQQDNWTSIAPKEGQGTISFDVAQEIRGFIQTKMNDVVSKTLEDFVVKAYSGNIDAVPSVKVANDVEVPSEDAKIAATEILSRLRNSAVPLASVRNDFSIQECYNNVYLTVPERCHWLYEAILAQASSFNLEAEHIFQSSSEDSIVWSSRYAGVPAWALLWTSGAEARYESDSPSQVGLHIEQGTGGRNWAQLPNLYPEGLWTDAERRVRGREARISKSVRDNMKEALDRGLVIPDQDLYLLTRFMPGETVDSLWDSLQMSDNQKYTPAQMYAVLKENGKAIDVKVECVGLVTTDPNAMTPKQKDSFAYDLSCRVVRKNSRDRKDLTRTLEIGRELEKRLEARNNACVDMSALTGYIDALKWGFLSYEGYSGQWIANLEIETAVGDRLPNKFMQQFAHFFGYKQYLQLDEETMRQITEGLNKKQQNATPEDFKKLHDQSETLKKAIHELRTAKSPADTPWKQDSPFAIAGNKSPWPMARLDFIDNAKQMGFNAEDIRSFYKSFEDLI